MFWNKKKKLKEQREKDYKDLNKRFQDKHQIVANYLCKNYLLGIGMQPVTDEGFSYQRRVKDFFGNKYGELPGSYNAFANVNYGFDKNFDHFPIEKLQKLYDEIEEYFPEPFIPYNREEKLGVILN